eukprot:TRINITY_DN246_c0_g1_i1.p1 TRINITY_DN246_c0_g1~~TRINITY_DN246_c0_g1_i1.p1  ORF type:complete len:239 (-),score=31.62 TRINITY_DN246_c0_g1_i1:45-761(-)
MKAILAVVLVLAAVALVVAAPPKPTWPKAFRTSFDFHSNENKNNALGAWYSSESLKSEKWDHEFDHQKVTLLRRYDTGKQFHITYERNKQAKCISAPLTGEMDVPNFANFSYVKTFVVDRETVDVWDQKTSQDTDRYEDFAKNEIPLSFSNKESRTLFIDFKVGDQSAALFAVPRDCKNATMIDEAPEQLGKCSIGQKLKCAAIIALCGAECCLGGCSVSSNCVKCMGAAWDNCHICF